MSCDLHCHSKISDGSMGIDEIIAVARRRGLNTIAITDHDAVAGATRAGVIGKLCVIGSQLDNDAIAALFGL